MLSKSAILSAEDRQIKTVHVPEWGGEVGLRVISGAERALFESLFEAKNDELFKVRFVACSLCDEKGARLFSNDEVEVLAEKSSKAIARLFEQCWDHSMLSQESVDEAGKG